MDFWFGHTERMRELQSKAAPIARSYAPVLIEGETGTGKERLAQHLHELRAAGGRLVKFLCDSSPSVMFGGLAEAEEAVKGLPETSRDTLLLKRVHRLPVSVQERVLRWFDESKRPFPFLISTTSDAVDRLTASQQFIPELLYRISAYRISLPPLRERRQDIPHVFRSMLAEIGQQMGVRAAMPDLQALEALGDYSWPGNLRELQNVAREFLLTPDSGALEAEMERRRQTISRNRTSGSPALKEQVKQASRRVEGEIILRVLEQHRWNRRRAAEALRISYRSLMYKMKSCDIRNESGVRRSVAQ
jgi:two-component system response regulator AtoC